MHEFREGADDVVAFDQDGQAVQLYYSMEQIGWDGKPRPAAARRKVSAPGTYPRSMEAQRSR